MVIRQPAVSGVFYPAHPERLRDMLQGMIPQGKAQRCGAMIGPHAGYVYSGGVAGAVYARVEVPQEVMLVSFNHRHLGRPLSVWPPGQWMTPLGPVPTADALSELVVRLSGGACFDETAFLGEHSAEVHVPFLQQRRPDVRIAFVSINLWVDDLPRITALGEAVAAIDRDFLLVASSDLNHYDDQDTTIRKDEAGIARILAMDVEGLADLVRAGELSMCGFAPVATAMAFAKKRGLKGELVEHKTSGDASGEKDSVVGYAAIVFR